MFEEMMSEANDPTTESGAFFQDLKSAPGVADD
jgi:hypothetical protein